MSSMSGSGEPRPARGKRLRAGLVDEVRAQGPRLALWRPVAFGAGAAVYFGLAEEPPGWVACVCLAVIGVIFAGLRRWAAPGGLSAALVLAGFALAGFAAGQIRTRAVDAPVVGADLGVVLVEGEVIDIRSPSAERWRLLIVPSRIGALAPGALAPGALPARVRIVTPPGDTSAPGDHVRMLALLNPPSGPASPGAYDFARDAFFERIGGVGVALSAVEASPGHDLRGLDAAEARLNRWRWALATRLTADLDALRGPGRPSTGLVAALATSHEAWLPKDAEDDLRGSGLAHMLAIAGLHMAAVSGFVYGAVRLAVAATPALAVRVSGHKLAAAFGLAAVLVYLALSGAHPPARRAAITAATVFGAILTDRRAVSLHALSIAALVVLMLEPECVVQPGFQMSFCATGALVALAEVWRPDRDRGLTAPRLIRVVQAVRDAALGLAVVATVAGLATGPFSIQHFNAPRSMEHPPTCWRISWPAPWSCPPSPSPPSRRSPAGRRCCAIPPCGPRAGARKEFCRWGDCSRICPAPRRWWPARRTRPCWSASWVWCPPSCGEGACAGSAWGWGWPCWSGRGRRRRSAGWDRTGRMRRTWWPAG